MTSGAQQAISIVTAAMARPGEVVLGEESTWPGLIDTVQQLGARYEPVRMDRDGIITDDLEAKTERVKRVAELSRRHRVPVLEDRVASDLGFDGRQLPTFDELVDQRRTQLRSAADMVIETLKRDFADWTFTPPEAA